MIWSPYYGRVNEVTRLNPNTGELIRFPLPFKKTAGIHSAIPSSDGTVWFTEAALSKIGHLNPDTEEITEYENLYPDGKPAGTHTVRVDENGRVWTSGGTTISSFDPKTKEFTHYGVAGTYGNVVGQNGDQWFTVFREGDSTIGRFNPKTGEVTEYPFPHSEISMREFFLDSQGRMWYGSPANDKIGYFIPPSVN